MKHYILKNSKMLISNMVIPFLHTGLNVPKKGILILESKFSCFTWGFETFEKFGGTNFKYFKYDNIAVKYQSKNTLIKQSSLQFFLARNGAFSQIWNRWFDMTSFFKLLPKTTKIRYFLSQTQSFLFWIKVFILTNSRLLISDRATVFSNSSPKIFKEHGTLHFDKLQGTDFKSDNSFFATTVQNYENKTILVPSNFFFL